MLTKAQILIDFMKWKRDQIAKKTDTPYFAEEDEKDILGWDVFQLAQAYYTIKDRVIHFKDFDDGNMCPFCVLSHHAPLGCGECSYGDHHGYCEFNGLSSYQKIKKAIGSDIAYFIGQEKIREYVKEHFTL